MKCLLIYALSVDDLLEHQKQNNVDTADMTGTERTFVSESTGANIYACDAQQPEKGDIKFLSLNIHYRPSGQMW